MRHTNLKSSESELKKSKLDVLGGCVDQPLTKKYLLLQEIIFVLIDVPRGTKLKERITVGEQRMLVNFTKQKTGSCSREFQGIINP